jgi:hypothetical protein
VRHFGIGLTFYCLLVAFLLDHLLRTGALRQRGLVALFALLIALRFPTSYLPLLEYGETDLGMRETPEGWANGLGMRETLAILRTLPPGILLVDPQWGHPGTPVWIYEDRLPRLEIVSITPELLASWETIREEARTRGGGLYVLLDARTPGERPWVDALLGAESLWAEKRVVRKVYRGRPLPDSSIVIAEAKPRAG